MKIQETIREAMEMKIDFIENLRIRRLSKKDEALCFRVEDNCLWLCDEDPGDAAYACLSIQDILAEDWQCDYSQERS